MRSVKRRGGLRSAVVGAAFGGVLVGGLLPGAAMAAGAERDGVPVEAVSQRGGASPSASEEEAVLKGRWQLDEASDSGMTPDSGPVGNDAVLREGARVDASAAFMGDKGLLLDGVDDYAETGTVPVDTSGSFTVTAWVSAAQALEESRVVLSVPGAAQSAFEISFSPDPDLAGGKGAWTLSMYDRDGGEATRSIAHNASDYSNELEWNHLALVYDGATKRALLYVNGSAQEAVCTDADGDGAPDDPECRTATPWVDKVRPFSAEGPLQIGRGKSDWQWNRHWSGMIDDVWAIQGALSEHQIQRFAGEWFELPTEIPNG